MKLQIIPYQKAGEINFNDTYDEIIEKIKRLYHLEYTESEQKVMQKIYRRIYIKDWDAVISFDMENNSIRYFEYFDNKPTLILNDIILTDKNYSSLLKLIKKSDNNLIVKDESFISEKYGIEVHKNPTKPREIESVLIFSKEYLSEPEIDLNEFYKSIMGEDYDLYD